jgi:hypothetical protein
MASVFVSYNSRDAELAESISAALSKRKHKVLSDRSLLGPSDNWREKLAHALETSDAVISLITENSVAASYPMSEIGAARALRKKLIPVVIGSVVAPNVIQDIFYISESFGEKSKGPGMKRIVNRIDGELKGLGGKDVFIVHGTNEAKKYELKSFLTGLELNPIILHEQDDKGKTIVEKFEYYAPKCRFAFILLTPDDKQDAGGKPEEKWRARQNVIMELGWFMAKLGREHVVMLHQGAVEIPSDVSGVIYLKFENSISEVGEQIRKRLRGVGLIG